MSQQLIDEMQHAEQWLTIVHSQQLFALSLARACRVEFGNLLLSEAKKCTEQPTPPDPNELALRQRKAATAMLKMSAIVHADAMAKQVPGAGAAILDAIRQLGTAQLPHADADFRQIEQATADAIAQISKLCAGNWSPQI